MLTVNVPHVNKTVTDFGGIYVARVFRIWDDLEMGHRHFQDPEHLPPKAIKP